MPKRRMLCYLLLSVLAVLFNLKTSISAPLDSHGSSSERIQTRMDNNLHLSGMIMTASKIFQVIQPLPGACAALKLLYQEVFDMAIENRRNNEQPLKNMMFDFGPIRLAFVADKLDKEIPWDVVAEVAWHMIYWSERGYAATFDRGYWNAAGTLGVYVGLRVLPLPHGWGNPAGVVPIP